MTDQRIKEQLIDLFKEAGPAHHRAYIETDGADPEWPIWYAGYMKPRVEGLLGKPLTQSKLIQLLVSAAEEQEKTAPHAEWTEFYADYFLSQLG